MSFSNEKFICVCTFSEWGVRRGEGERAFNDVIKHLELNEIKEKQDMSDDGWMVVKWMRWRAFLCNILLVLFIYSLFLSSPSMDPFFSLFAFFCVNISFKKFKLCRCEKENNMLILMFSNIIKFSLRFSFVHHHLSLFSSYFCYCNCWAIKRRGKRKIILGWKLSWGRVESE